MSEQTELNVDEGNEPESLADVRAALKREQKRRKEAEEQANEGAAAKRELTFLRAGVDLDSPVGKLFAKAYDGELDPDAIKKEWSDIAPSATTTTTEEGGEEQSGDEAEGLNTQQAAELAARRAALASGANPPGDEPSSPLGQSMMDAAFEAQGGARSRPAGGFGPKARDAAFDVLFGRAKQGDPDAIYKQPGEDWRDAKVRYDNEHPG